MKNKIANTHTHTHKIHHYMVQKLTRKITFFLPRSSKTNVTKVCVSCNLNENRTDERLCVMIDKLNEK